MLRYMKDCFWFSIFLPMVFLSSCHTLAKKNEIAKRIEAGDSINIRYKLVSDELKMPLELNEPTGSDGRMFITDNKGEIWILKNDSISATPFLNIYEKIGEQPKNSPVGMIFSVAFHPEYATNKKFYVCYNAPSKIHTDHAKLIVSEFIASRDNPNVADLKSEHKIIEFKGSTVQNNGAQIAFGPDGYLYISLGDDSAGDTSYRHHAQDLKYFNGKLLRIDVNKTPYAIPADNPFVDVKNARPEIWAYGFRKLWRFSFDPVSHQLFGADIGQNKEEEIDIITKGGNYGWPIREGDSSFENNNYITDTSFTAPINTYNHAVGICVVGGCFYYGNDIPDLKNKYVFADFRGDLFTLVKDNDKWQRKPLKVFNTPEGSFFICGCSLDSSNHLYIMGYVIKDKIKKGVVYQLEKV
jgi:glucose/arabinose dehydrogenase